jgi:hypothetical protein
MAGEGDLADLIGRHAGEMLAQPGVVGIAEGLRDGTPCVVVFVDPSVARPPMPPTLEGHPVFLEPVARFEAHPGYEVSAAPAGAAPR